MQKVIFIDRDGVINHEVGYLHTISDFRFIDGVFDTTRALADKGFKLIIITNQSGIGRGYYTIDAFHTLTQWMLSQFRREYILISNVMYCPHAPDAGCDCRKPKPGMFIQANKLHGIDIEQSWMIGDKEDDVRAANNFGITNTILVESGHAINKEESNARYILPSIKEVNGVI